MFWIARHFRRNVKYSQEVWMKLCVTMLWEVLTMGHLVNFLSDSRANKLTRKVSFEPLESILSLFGNVERLKKLFWLTATLTPSVTVSTPKPVFGCRRTLFPLPPTLEGYCLWYEALWLVKSYQWNSFMKLARSGEVIQPEPRNSNGINVHLSGKKS